MEYTTTIERPEPTALDLVQDPPVSDDPRVKIYVAQVIYPSGEWHNLNVRVIPGRGEVFLATQLAGIFADKVPGARVGDVSCPADVRAEAFATDDEF
jgi:hypothetical protein